MPSREACGRSWPASIARRSTVAGSVVRGAHPIFHVYERAPEPWLLELAGKLRAQGVDYRALFATEDLAVATPRRGLWKWTKHVVNTGMAAKASALGWRLDQRPEDRAFSRGMIDFLDRHHGQVTGMFAGDECLAGRNPLQGTELCSVVEFDVPRSSTCSRPSATRSSATGSSAWRSTRCPPPSRPTCGRISTTSR